MPDTDKAELHSLVYEYAGVSDGITEADAALQTAKDAEITTAQSKDVTFLIN